MRTIILHPDGDGHYTHAVARRGSDEEVREYPGIGTFILPKSSATIMLDRFHVYRAKRHGFIVFDVCTWASVWRPTLAAIRVEIARLLDEEDREYLEGEPA